MTRRFTQRIEDLIRFGWTYPPGYTQEKPQVSLSDLAGQEEAKRNLKDVIDFLHHSEQYRKVGASVPFRILFIGQPGTGKRTLARALAGEAGALFYNLDAPAFVDPIEGIRESRLQQVFEMAKASAPAVIFLDGLDEIARFSGGERGITDRMPVLQQLLVVIHGLDPGEELLIIAATNRPELLEFEWISPAWFSRKVQLYLPNYHEREMILSLHTRPLHLAMDVNLGMIARTTTGLSGGDLANLCRKAALAADENNKTRINQYLAGKVTMADFDEALERLLIESPRKLLLDDHERLAAAYHEAGHALAAWLNPFAVPIQKVSIVARDCIQYGRAQLPGDDGNDYNKDNLLAWLGVMLGGRASEEIAMGEITTSSQNDLISATRLARKMVAVWGMGRLGLMAYDLAHESTGSGDKMHLEFPYSEETAVLIDHAVQDLLQERYTQVLVLLRKARKLLDPLAETLMQKETLYQDDLIRILGARSFALSEVENES